MSVKHPRVAVLLAAYNGMQWIDEQLTSILDQVGVDVTVYISVDTSTDGTEVWCENYANNHSSVIVLPPAGTFGGAARNFFRLIRDVELYHFDFVAFADQDDIWHSDKLERATSAIQECKVDAYSSNVTAFWPNGGTHLLNKAQPQVEWDFLFEAAGPGCTYVMGREVIEMLKASVTANWVQLQNVSLHDWYCYAFARSHGFRWYIDPKSSMEYRQHERNQIGANKGLSSLISRYKTIYDGWWFSQVQLITRLVGRGADPFVREWLSLRRAQLLRLSFSAWRCRRRRRDKVFFFCICWATALIGKKVR
ncbi:Alpha-L-Rha alpha-1,3-L-rhamnosyltransferase [Pseudomonas chlororaphis subsp. aureofaciens]|uniref:Alpha-L-Rha alpha-1,3-L-rhamnosyltransferase n=1 Tax=Pseudomonas chlororaphis subsp. aureofaciens TaxID=587851 RepID=A0AAD0ZRG6_9PSED|nr:MULTISPECIES: glycosyltransferase [Pseudomonas]AIC21451.1 glycosyl transferase [Pseudomonas chlororaphis]AZE24986.1 Alpha-L-Rha alpha-1,3-L-rhamnosyltransferase [Pseudomonas chlororaphis subsp. aureofaciens]AZE31186.1 Alpha-L-Rha alpha-1,3-L-rhamnosyltransferase [Pseudomonas chlororaphis subsp. aureofaciens]AZE37500.1 Alpha-L-Rha alpha-1,3-L-rhamnosyltransferase [Pseudomonas chlororaphis subsp. aureofaciens]AZE43899.1 Alpha-L-Rha alpha-1,3-L-rhamnosyltransferase [Pseudomonas chlororaphis su